MKVDIIREVISMGIIELEKIPSEENSADSLTKSIPSAKLQHCVAIIGMKSTNMNQGGVI